MRVIGFLLFALLVSPIAISAGIPCPATSSCQLEIVIDQPCANGDAMRCIAAAVYDVLTVRATVRDCAGEPVSGCPVLYDIWGYADPHTIVEPAIMMIEGAQSASTTTDAAGAVAFPVNGGGAGRVAIFHSIRAGNPLIQICLDSDTLCVKSSDMTGDLTVNFFDVFKWLPQSSAGLGWPADLNCQGTVNFFDLFSGFLARLNMGATGTGFELFPADLGPDCE